MVLSDKAERRYFSIYVNCNNGIFEMEFISFKNFRCFEDTGKIELRKLNLLIGGNSSGKSSFLRFFPLLRQSIETETKGPILWYDRYVDFGTFDSAIRRNSEKKEISFGFTFKGSSFLEAESIFRWTDYSSDNGAQPDFSVSVNLAKRKKGWQTYISSFEVDVGWADGEKDILRFDVGDDQGKAEKVFINDEKINVQVDINSNNIIPEIEADAKDANIDFPPGRFYAFKREYLNSLKDLTQTSKRDLLRNYVEKIVPSSKSVFVDGIRKLIPTSNVSDQKIADFHKIWLLNYVSQTLFIIRRAVEMMAARVHYITPTRANAERYYRLKDLQVNQVDFDGKNLAMFLNHLSEEMKGKFSSWCQENFGIKITTKEKDGQLSIYVNDEQTNHDENIIDTGFGYSQVIPIIASLWSAVIKNEKKLRPTEFLFSVYNGPKIFVIEQPELHLHPRLQAKLGQIFTKSISIAEENKIDLRLIIETHSETLINKIARAVATDQNRLIPHFQILIFDKKNQQSEISVAKVTEDGVVKNWPYGFFEEENIDIGEMGGF